ncbi:MAG: hypothetical protein KME43_16375 [Myxacorys chilensis ATA2-1-KO14]|jgi:hypothetical protein|nr:hypothetical protein [Myxacorys chilensis ATA2-1-KO14]
MPRIDLFSIVDSIKGISIFLALHADVCAFIWVLIHGQSRDAIALVVICFYLGIKQ